MELILNLAWLLLAVPACWLWRNGHIRRRFTPCQCLLALGCMLALLFPVVSATDDLRAMRAEMEESPSGKRSFCLKTGDKPSVGKSQVQPALAATSSFAVPNDGAWHWRQPSNPVTPTALTVIRTGRSPPASSPS